MSITKDSKEYHEKMFPGYHSSFLETDPEFIERFDNFAFDEVMNHDDLDGKTCFMAILATLLGCQGIDEFRTMISAALNFGVTPVEIKEIVYQAVAYLGIGRVFPFLKATNEVLTAQGGKAAPPRTGGNDNRKPSGGRRKGANGHYGRRHEGFLEVRSGRKPSYQLLADKQLLWRLLHPHRSHLSTARNDYLLLSFCTGRLRTAACLPCRRKYEDWQR